MSAGTWAARARATDWDSVRAGLDADGCALTGPLATAWCSARAIVRCDPGAAGRPHPSGTACQ